jgi:hypothetical protein
VRRLTKGYAAAVALGAVALLGACTTPTTPTNGSGSISTATTSAPTAPQRTTSDSAPATTTSIAQGVPDAARANTPQGAEAFTRYFGDVVNRAFVDQNEVSLQSLVSPECKSCSGIFTSIVSYRQKGQRFVGQYLNVTGAVYSSELNGVSKVLATTDQAGGKVVSGTGSIVETAPPSKGNLAVQLEFDGGWRVLEMQGVA